MHLPTSDDRTARARIRDEALRLFAHRGSDAVTMRDVAAAAGVSPALLVRHYGSKDGLVEAVDDHVVRSLETLLTHMTEAGLSDAAMPRLLDGLAAQIPPDSPIPSYLTRALITGGQVGPTLFRRLYEISKDAFDAMVKDGTATPGGDPAVRAAFLLVNDLAVLALRSRLTETLGVDPLSSEGAKRWGTQVFAIYRDGLTGDA